MKLNTLILAAGIFIFGTQAAYELSDYLSQFNSIVNTVPAVKKINSYLVNSSIKISNEMSRLQDYLTSNANRLGSR